MSNLAEQVPNAKRTEEPDENLQDGDSLLGEQWNQVSEVGGKKGKHSDGSSEYKEDSRAGLRCWVVLGFCVVCLLGAYMLIRKRYPAPHFGVLLGKDGVSKLDNRVYQFGKLDSGLNYLVVQDTKASKVGMAVAINAGGYDNPKELPGLAHFLEHMVFLGSNRYGPDSGWDEFMGKMDGYNNAYTADEQTVYFSELSGKGFHEGIDRLGAAVQSPLLLKEKLKEVHAVDSEHTKNREVPVWRIDRISNLIADPDGFTGAFQTGDINTLEKIPAAKNVDVAKALKEFHRVHYCAQNMVVVIFDNISVRLMAENVATSFKEDRSKACPATPVRPAHQSLVGTYAHMYAENYPTPRMTINFPIPLVIDQDPAKAPQIFLRYLLNYYGEDGSGLQGILNSRALVIESKWFLGSSSFDSQITFQAVPMPGVDWKVIVAHLLAYVTEVIHGHELDLATAQSVSAAQKFTWEWNLMEGRPSELASTWAASFSSLVDKSDAGLRDFMRPSFRTIDIPFIKQILSYIRYDNCNIILADKGPVEDGVALENYKVEPNYDIKYVTQKLPSVGEAPTLTAEELRVPPALPAPPVITKTVEQFMCAGAKEGNIDALGTAYGDLPESINGNAGYFYRYGSVFAVPKYTLYATIITQHVVDSTAQEAKLYMFESALKLAMEPMLEKYSYQSMVKLRIRISIMSTLVINFELSGIYSEASKDVITKAFDLMLKKDFATDALTKRTIQQLTNQLTDYSQEGPLSSAYTIFRKARTQYVSQRADVYKELPSDLADTVTFVRETLAKPVRIDYFAIGGIDKPDALGLQKVFENQLKINPTFFPVYPSKVRAEELNLIYSNPQTANINGVGILLYEHVTADGTLVDWESRAMVSIINLILGPFTFIQLRQNAKTPPYTVTGAMAVRENAIQLVGAIQDHKMMPKEQIALLTKHLTVDFKEKLRTLDDAVLETYKTSLKATLSAPPNSSANEFDHFEDAIYYDGRQNCFQKELMMSHAVDSVMKSELVALYDKILASTRSTAEMYPEKEDLTKIKTPEQKTLQELKDADAAGNVKWYAEPKGSVPCHGRLLAFQRGGAIVPSHPEDAANKK